MRGTTMEDTDALHREQVVRRVGVVVDAAEERGRRVLADELDEFLFTELFLSIGVCQYDQDR